MKKMVLSSIAGIYKNQKWRELSFVGLLGTSIRYFKKAYVITNISLFVKQWNELKKGIEPLSIDFNFSEENLIDKIKIVLCFENYLKGIMVKKGYLIHFIDSKIAQKKFKSIGNISERPIRLSEYKRIENLVTDEKSDLKTLRGLKEQTIGLNTLLNNQSYINIHKTPQHIIDIVKKMNLERNFLHLRITDGSTCSDEYISNLVILIRFVNLKMVKEYNRSIRKIKGEKYGKSFCHKEIIVPNNINF